MLSSSLPPWTIDLERLKMWEPLHGLLSAPGTTDAVKTQTLWVIGTAVQNNPKAQEAVCSFPYSSLNVMAFGLRFIVWMPCMRCALDEAKGGRWLGHGCGDMTSSSNDELACARYRVCSQTREYCTLQYARMVRRPPPLDMSSLHEAV